MATIYTDPVTGVYEDDSNNWFLKNGTPITDYDPKTGAYEEGGSWYTFQGLALQNYSKDLGAYQQQDDLVWYDVSGKEVLMNSALYNALKAYGFDVSSNTTPQGQTPKVSANTTASKSSPSMLVPVIGIVGVVVLVGIVYMVMKKK